MAAGNRICPYCGQNPCICGKVLRKMLRNTFPKMNLPPEEPKPNGTKGKAIKSEWRVRVGSEYITIYAYSLTVCEDEHSVVADGVKITYGRPIEGANQIS